MIHGNGSNLCSKLVMIIIAVISISNSNWREMEWKKSHCRNIEK